MESPTSSCFDDLADAEQISQETISALGSKSSPSVSLSSTATVKLSSPKRSAEGALLRMSRPKVDEKLQRNSIEVSQRLNWLIQEEIIYDAQDMLVNTEESIRAIVPDFVTKRETLASLRETSTESLLCDISDMREVISDLVMTDWNRIGNFLREATRIAQEKNPHKMEIQEPPQHTTAILGSFISNFLSPKTNKNNLS